MSKLKNKKYYALIGIVVLAIGLICLFTFGKIDKYKGQIKVKNVVSKTTSLSASVMNTVENETTSKGSDEIKYQIKYTLDEVSGVTNRNVVIEGKLKDEEARYARFKEINRDNITSTISNDGKEIEIHIENVPLGEEQDITLRVVINNAPNGFKIKPSIKIKEETGEETSVLVNEVEVVTNSLEGKVIDKNGLAVSNIELSLNDETGEIKRTYTDEDGNYIFSDIENKAYSVDVEEEIYEKSSEEVKDDKLEIVVKEVSPYEIEAHKYITKLDLIVNGKEEHYTYNDLERVVQNVKNAKTIGGEITYKISVKNIGEKAGRISKITDTVDNGLSFNKDKNIGWVEKDGKLYYSLIEGTTIGAGETKEIGLRLDIKNTTAIKTYINEADVNGETYEKVVFILNGQKYREEEVILGEKIDEPVISDESFSGWYTDKNYTNKYKFSNEVTKDLILYGKTEVLKHTVEFYDKNPLTDAEIKYQEQIVDDGEKLTRPTDPSHEGFEFECWMDEHDNIWNFSNPVERDMRLTSCYSIITYNISYKGLTNEEKESLSNPITYTIKTPTITLNNPENRRDDVADKEIFMGWTGSNGVNPSKTVTIPQGSTGDKEFTANFEEVDDDEFTILYNLDDGHLEEGKTNPNTYTIRSETITLNNPSKDHYDFIGWTGTDLAGLTPTVIIPHGSSGDREYTANYRIRTHNVTFNDYDLESASPTDTVTQFGDIAVVNEGSTVTPPVTNPEHTGYTCDRWSTKINGDYNNDAFDFTTPIEEDTVLYTLCKKNIYTVTYMNGDEQYEVDRVPYKEKTTAPSPDPTKVHNRFIGWTLSGSLYNFDTPVTDNLTLYSSYEEVKAPEINHVPTEWTNQNVSVTVSKNGSLTDDTGYTYKYRVENGTYTDYVNPFEIEENCDVYAVAYKSNIASEETKHEIRNIDKINPQGEIHVLSTFYTGFVVNVESIDNESGLEKIELYIDDNLYGVFNYYEDFNEEKSEIYSFDGLEQGTEYEIKMLSYDRAGNVEETVSVNRTAEEERIVARIIGANGYLFNDESMYINLPTLYAGINYKNGSINCITSQCTIQMLENVEETNDILNGQDITLDLNGKTITGVRDYTFNNSGEFTIVDDGITPGLIVNNNNTAIINETTGILTMGRNETPSDVSLTIPNVIGNAKGIVNNGIFDYYDGRVEGIVAIDGMVNDTPYLYNANITVGDETQVSGLYYLENAEARIQNKYYTKVKEAVEDSKKGHIDQEEVTKANVEGMHHLSLDEFVLDDNSLVSSNHNNDTKTEGYYYIDLRSETGYKLLTVDASISSDAGDIGYGVLRTTSSSPSYYTTNSDNIFYMSGEEQNRVSHTLLQGGYQYYIFFAYVKNDDGISSGSDEFSINNIELSDYTAISDFDSIDILSPGPLGSFEYENGHNIVTSNNTDPNTRSMTSLNIDLTNSPNDKMLSFTATAETIELHGAYYAYFYINGSNIGNISQGNTRNFEYKLAAGKNYEFRIESNSNSVQTICKLTVSNIKLTTLETTNLQSYTENPTGALNVTYNATDKSLNIIEKAANTSGDVYFTYDLTNETDNKEIKISGLSGVNKNGQADYIYLTNSPDTPDITSSTNRVFVNEQYGSWTYNTTATLTAGQVNYLHFIRTRNSNSGIARGHTIYSITSPTNIVEDPEYPDELPVWYAYNTLEKNNEGVIVPKERSTPYVYNKTYYTGEFYVDLTNEKEDKIIGIQTNSSISIKNLNTGGTAKKSISDNSTNPSTYYSVLNAGDSYKITISGNNNLKVYDILHMDTSGTNQQNTHQEIIDVPVLNEDPDRIQILRDITLTEPLEIVTERNAIMDLNGYNLSNPDDYVIKNYGSLRITDNVSENDINQYNDRISVLSDEVLELQEKYRNDYVASMSDYRQDDLYLNIDSKESVGRPVDLLGNVPDIAFYGSARSDISALQVGSGGWNNTGMKVAVSNPIDVEDTSFTYESVFSIAKSESRYFISIYLSGENISEKNIIVYSDSENKLTLSGSTLPSIDIGTKLEVGKLYNMSFVFNRDTNNIEMYINGENKYTITTMDLNDFQKVRYEIFSSLTSSELNSNIYSGRMYKAALTQKELINHYYIDLNRNMNVPYSYHDVPWYDGDMSTSGDMGGFMAYSRVPYKIRKISLYYVEGYEPSTMTVAAGLTSSSVVTKGSVYALDEENNKIDFVFTSPEYLQMIYVSATSPNHSVKVREIIFDYEESEYNNINFNFDINNYSFNTISGTKNIIYNAENANLSVDNIKLTTTSTSTDQVVINNFGNLLLDENSYIYANYSTGVLNNEVATASFNNSKINAKIGFRNASKKQKDFSGMNIQTSQKGFQQDVAQKVTIDDSKIVTSYDYCYYGSGTEDLLVENSYFETPSDHAIYRTNNIELNNSELRGTFGSINNLKVVDSTVVSKPSSYMTINNSMNVNNSVIKVDYSGYSSRSDSSISLNLYDNSSVIDSTFDGFKIHFSGSSSSRKEFLVKDSNLRNYSSYDTIESSTAIAKFEGTNYVTGISNYGSSGMMIGGTLTTERRIYNNSFVSDYCSYPCGLYVDNATIHYSTASSAFELSGTNIFSGSTKLLINSSASNPAILISNGELTIKDDFEMSDGWPVGIKHTSSYNDLLLTLGELDDKVTNNIIVRGSADGLLLTNRTTFNYYDGTIIGPVDFAINGNVSATPEGYELKHDIDEDNDIEVVTLSNDLNDFVAQIGSEKYKSLKLALDAVPYNEETEITILKDISTITSLEIEENKDVIIDLNGKTIISNSPTLLTNNGKLKLYDSQKTHDLQSFKVISNGDFEIEDVYFGNKFTDSVVQNQGALSFINSKVDTLESKITSNSIYIKNSTIRVGNILGHGEILGSDFHYLNVTSSPSDNITASDSTINYLRAYGTVICNDCTFTVLNSNESSITNTGSLTINGGSISFGSISKPAITNNSGSTLTLDDGVQIQAQRIAIDNNNILNIRSANIVSNTYTAITSKGNVVLGVKGDNVSIEDPSIKGEEYGIQCETGNVYFYDGIVKGKTKAINGLVEETEDLYDVYITSQGDYNVNYLVSSPTARIESTGEEFFSLQEAFDAVTVNGETVTLLKNILVSNNTFTISSDKNIIFDMNGFNITNNYSTLFSVGGSLRITDGTATISNDTVSSYGSSKIILSTSKTLYSENKPIFENTGTLEILGITIDYIFDNDYEGKTDTKYAEFRIFTNSGTLSINGLVTNAQDTKYLPYNGIYSSGTLLINNSILYAYDNVVKNTGTASISNSTIRGEDAVINDSNATMELNNNTINSYKSINSSGLKHPIDNSGTLTINGGTYSSEGFTTEDHWGNTIFHGYLINNKNTITINDGTFYVDWDSSGSFISSNSSSTSNTTVTINGGEFYSGKTHQSGITAKNLTINDGKFNNVSISSKEIININGGKYIDSYIENEEATITITKCDFSAEDRPAIKNEKNGVLILGTKDGTFDANDIVISASSKNIGIKNTATFKYYDGTIIGTEAIDGPVYEIDDNYSIYSTANSNYETKYQLKDSTISKTVRNTRLNKSYFVIDDAIAEAEPNDTLEYLRKVTYTTVTPTTTIGSSKNIIIDFNGKTVDADNLLFENNGTVKFVDSSNKNGVLKSYNHSVINNNNNMSFESFVNNSYLVSAATAINNGLGTYNSIISTISIVNNGTMNIKNSNLKYINNTGTLSLDDSVISKILNTGTTTSSNENSITELENNSTYNSTSTQENITLFINRSVASGNKFIVENLLNSGTINNISVEGNVYNKGIISLNNSNVKINSDNNLTIDNSTVIDGSIIRGTSVFDNVSGKLTNDGTLSATNSSLIVKNTSNLTISNNVGGNITNEGTLLYQSGTVGVISNIRNATATVLDGTIGTINNVGTLTLGVKDGVASNTNPSVGGSSVTTGLTNTGTFYYYDGVIKGSTNSLNGQTTEIEDEYEIYNETVDNTKVTYLKKSGEVARVIVINNINYPNLQAAINSCPIDGTETIGTLYTNITLDEIVNVPEGVNLKVYLNGFTISPEEYVTNHSGNGSIEIVTSTPGGVGGSIYRFLANITGSEINPRDIIIYQMEDGSELDSAATYKLYKLIDNEYKVVEVKENEIGNYELGYEKNILRTTTRQINIRGIGEGSYKLVGSDSKELEFNINSYTVSNNIRVDRYTSKANQTAHIVATLILTLQTGMIRHPYIVVITSLVVIIIGTIAYKKKKED